MVAMPYANGNAPVYCIFTALNYFEYGFAYHTITSMRRLSAPFAVNLPFNSQTKNTCFVDTL